MAVQFVFMFGFQIWLLYTVHRLKTKNILEQQQMAKKVANKFGVTLLKNDGIKFPKISLRRY